MGTGKLPLPNARFHAPRTDPARVHRIQMKPIDRYIEIVSDRPVKMDAKEAKYTQAAEGSFLRCAACLHYFRRAIDGFAVCEIFRDEESDREGVLPDWRCQFWTCDGDVFPLLERDEEGEEPDEETIGNA
jgi:hypothetical protein